ncbi:hypothetical protein CMI37_04480 [Candidatus Pacearchaeota archaeon]|nr:hypothetical protein [Candidatus Pacearchaeota archaeon]|tara:strand:+ start:572 stop:1351 length:780 start_codon:yes stop_codon:yes gene_type:complete
MKITKPDQVFPPPRIVLSAVEGWGKTTAGAYAPNSCLIMSEHETGYLTLRGSGLVPEVDCGLATNWVDLLNTLETLAKPDHPGYGVLALDAINGFERMCHERVCQRDFKGDWGEKGFTSYQKGYDVAVTDWLQMLIALDNIRAKGTTILLIAHVQVRPFGNPLGADYDRYVVDVHKKTWGVTLKWADAVLFGNFKSVIDAKTGKAVGRADRRLFTERRDGYDAKNRYGMPEYLDIPADPTRVWSSIWDSITAKRGGSDA